MGRPNSHAQAQSSNKRDTYHKAGFMAQSHTCDDMPRNQVPKIVSKHSVLRHGFRYRHIHEHRIRQNQHHGSEPRPADRRATKRRMRTDIHRDGKRRQRRTPRAREDDGHAPGRRRADRVAPRPAGAQHTTPDRSGQRPRRPRRAIQEPYRTSGHHHPGRGVGLHRVRGSRSV